MNAQQLTIDLDSIDPLVTPERFAELVTAQPPRPVPTWTHDLTAAIRDSRCFQCGAPNATPDAGSNVPYCARCKRAHTARMKAAHPEWYE